jgi:hypothetical protein
MVLNLNVCLLDRISKEQISWITQNYKGQNFNLLRKARAVGCSIISISNNCE